MTVTREDVALAEFTALRAEIILRAQLQSGLVTAALTIVAAIGGFALAKEDGRTEMLLVLPLVLGGLGILVVDFTKGSRVIGAYIRDCVWPALPHEPCHGPASWEHYLTEERDRHTRRLGAYTLSGTVPHFIIFGVPGVAALLLTESERHSDLGPLWWGGVASLALFAMLAVTLVRPPDSPNPAVEP